MVLCVFSLMGVLSDADDTYDCMSYDGFVFDLLPIRMPLISSSVLMAAAASCQMLRRPSSELQ
jgi:hypothetical protein